MKTQKMKGGMNMKNAIIVALMLVMSVFATYIAVAEEGSGSSEILPTVIDASVSTSAGDIDDEADLDIEKEIVVTLDASEDVPSTWRGYPANAFWGQGWITGNDAGHMIRIVGVSKSFATTNSVSDSTNSITTITRGKIKIDGRSFVIYNKQTGDSVIPTSFDVMKDKTKIGTLTLTNSQEFGSSFKVWTGKLTLEDKEYNVNLATNQRAVKPVTREDRVKVESDDDDDRISVTDVGPNNFENAEVAKAKARQHWWEFWRPGEKGKSGEGTQDRSGSNSGKG